jgi:hypothetical protein
MWIAGMVGKPASREMQEFIDSIRVPTGAVKNIEVART